MPKYVPVVTEIGTLWGRDAIYLHSVTVSEHQSTITLCGEFNCTLSSNPPRAKWQAYRLCFCGILALHMTELDTWEALQEGRWPETSFDEVVDSPWVARIQGKAGATMRHFVFQTYDEVFEVLCTTFQLELGETSD